MYHPHHLSIISIPTFAKSSLSLSSSPSSSSPPLTSSSSVNPLEINPKPPSNSNTSHVDMGNLIPSSDTPSPQSEHLIMKTSSSSATPFNNDSNCDSNHSSNQTYTTTKCSKPSNLRYQSIQQVSSAQSNSSQSLNPYSGNSTQTDVKSRKFGLTLNISPYPQSDTNLNSKWNSSLPSNNPISPQLPSRKTHSSSPPISPTILEHSRVFASPASISYPSPTHLFPSNLTSLSFVYDASAVSKDKDNSNPSSPFQPLSSSSMPLPPLTPPPRVASQRQFPRSSSPSSPSLSPQPRLPSLQVQPSPSIHSRILLSPSRHHNRLPQSPSSLCSPYASELTQSPAFQPRSGGWSSRQSSLPSLMSMPPTRAASPDQTASSSSSSQHQHLNGSLSSRLLPHSSALNSVFRAQNQASGSSSPSLYQKSSSSSPLAAVNAAFAIGSTGSTNVSQGRSSSRVLKHYERVRSPSLRGHSRTTSFSELAIPSKLNSPSILNFSPRDRNSASVEFEMPIELGEETLRPEEESRSFDFQCDWSGEDNFEYNGLNEARKVFKPGERIGVGIFHQGHRVRNVFEASEGVSRRLSLCSSGPAGSGLLEIVGQIGVGTYAVVYLVREVLYDPDLELDSTHPDTSLSQTPRASDGFAALSPESGQPSTISLRRRRKSSSIIYGRDFALKCLCKQNLSRELLMIQRGEAELHQSLPLHENIVSLYWALETPNWLFMVIEYCPGQDLFYWLEQSKDSQDLESLASRANSYSAKFPSFTSDHTTTFRSSMSAPFELLPKPSEPTSMDHNTPPSPSLLATTADDEMLSRRRLRLISRMFVQMCDAVQACHLAGVCHRDIKPENFIVVDYRQSNSSSSHEREKSVIVKITDWGLGTSSKICEDFDCGSKPYMSYECRNNLHPCYAPAPADVWSLGIVLLNLLYHRCPWSDPSLTDADFNQFKRDPINFFCGRFEGMTGSVAEFLANRVFCEVGYNEAGHRKERITAGEFGEWAKDLLSHMGGGQLHASVSDSTIVMSPSVGRSGLFYGDTLPPSEASKVSHNPLLQLLNSPTISDCESRDSKFSEAGNRRKGLVKKLSDLFLEPSLKLNFAAAASDPIRGDYDEDAMLFEEEEERRLSAKLLFEKGREGYYDESRRVADSETQLERGSRCLIKGKRVEFPGKRLETKNVTTISLPTMEATASDEHDGFSDVSQNFLPENNELKKVLNQEKGFSNIGRRRLNLAGRMLEKFRDGSNPELQAFVKQSKSLEASLLRAPQPHNNYVPPHGLKFGIQNRKSEDPIGSKDKGLISRGQTSVTSASSSGASTTTSGFSSIWGGNSHRASELSSSSKASHWSSASNRRERIKKTNKLQPVRPTYEPSATSNEQNKAFSKKEESKNRLAMLLTSFKRFNSSVGAQNQDNASRA